jgi:hypothetical protein
VHAEISTKNSYAFFVVHFSRASLRRLPQMMCNDAILERQKKAIIQIGTTQCAEIFRDVLSCKKPLRGCEKTLIETSGILGVPGRIRPAGISGGTKSPIPLYFSFALSKHFLQ